MPSRYLPDNDHVVRIVPWSLRYKSEDNSVGYGPVGGAFRLRDTETYLSSSWCEYFYGSFQETLRCVLYAMMSTRKIGGKACLAVARVSELHAFANGRNRKLRIVHEPEVDNVSHVALRRWRDFVDDDLEELALDVWSEYFEVKDVDLYPESECVQNQWSD